MKKIKIVTVFALLLSVTVVFFNVSLSVAEETVTVLSFKLPRLIVNETDGTYILLLREVERRTGVKFDIVFRPIKRAVKEFREGKAEMFFPALKSQYDNNDRIILSEEIFYTKKDYIFSLKTEPVLRSASELRGKRIGIVRGYLEHTDSKEMRNENRDFIIDETAELVQNAKKLSIGRVNAIVAEEITMLEAFKITNTLKDIHYDKDAPISSANVYYSFHDNSKNRELDKKISGALKEMKNDGTYEKILGSSHKSMHENSLTN